MKSLEQLSIEYQNAKGSQWHNYMTVYDHYFEPIRDKVKSVLEIGVAGGVSLKIWQEYFSNAQIYGIDTSPSCINVAGDRIKVFIGPQQDFLFLASIVNRLGDFDIIIDDGGHVLPHQLASCLALLPHVKPDGFYIIEDVPLTNLEFYDFFCKQVAGREPNKLEILPLFTGPINESILGFRRKA